MGKLYKLYAGVFIVCFLASGCKKADKDPIEIPLKAEDFLNVSYGANAGNVMDVYLLQSRDENTPVILLLHGGSWFEGDKSSLTDLAKYWRARGYASITMNYRLTHTSENNIHPAQVNDIRKAIDYAVGKSEEWQVADNRFALQGASAGGHLALLYSYKYNETNRVKAVISMAGPTDLVKVQQASVSLANIVSWLVGATYQADPASYAEASPITHVDSTSTPTLLFHGKLDVTVPYQQAEELKSELERNGVDSKLVIYEDTGHEVLSLNNTASFLADCEKWFELHLR